MRPSAGRVCTICGEALINAYSGCTSDEEPRCGLCQRMQPLFAKAAAYGSYVGGLRELIHLLKYERVRPAANVLGRMLAEAITDLKPAFGDTRLLVVPVPLHARKLGQRGFNQAELITRAALKLKPAGEQLGLNGAVLQRCRETQAGVDVSRQQRRQNMCGAFAVIKPGEVEGREVLLVDDVYATGATVSECARVLRRAGATRVWVATVARTLRSDAAYAITAEPEKARVAMAAHG